MECFIYEDMIDHRSYTHNLSSCEIKKKAWKIQAWTRFQHEVCYTTVKRLCSN